MVFSSLGGISVISSVSVVNFVMCRIILFVSSSWVSHYDPLPFHGSHVMIPSLLYFVVIRVDGSSILHRFPIQSHLRMSSHLRPVFSFLSHSLYAMRISLPSLSSYIPSPSPFPSSLLLLLNPSSSNNNQFKTSAKIKQQTNNKDTAKQRTS